MLTEERLKKIESIVNSSGSITVSSLMREFDASESTIRRDLAQMDKEGRLLRVRGGAISLKPAYDTSDDKVLIRQSRNTSEKQAIASYAASLITDSDFVFLDAGTTVEMMIPFITSRKAVFVTNALSHATKLAEMEFMVYIVGGEFKNITEAIVGEEALLSLSKYNFTKGFFGTNGVHKEVGYSTPELRESRLKNYAMSRCLESYILADASKFSQIASVSFAKFEEAKVITEYIPKEYRKCSNIMEVAK